MATFKNYTKHGEKYYMFQVYLGKDKLTGKEIRTTRRGFKTKKEAQKALRQVQADFESGKFSNQLNSPKTFGELFNLWFDNVYKHKVKEATLSTAKERYKLYLKKYENMNFKKMDVAFCQQITNQFAEKYAGYKAITKFISMPLDYAVKLEIIDSNPFKKITYPKSHGNSRPRRNADNNFYSKKELKEFLNILEDYSKNRAYYLYPFCRLLAFTGMRIGEATALTWDDIDFKKKKLEINKGKIYIVETKEYKITDPKTKKSKRTLYLDDKTLHILKEWQITQQKLFFANGISRDSTDLMFTKLRSPKVLSNSNVENDLHYFYSKHKSLKEISPHGFRHTHASLLFEAGATLKEVQERLGHSNSKTTLEIYTHVTKSKQKETPEIFANYIDL